MYSVSNVSATSEENSALNYKNTLDKFPKIVFHLFNILDLR